MKNKVIAILLCIACTLAGCGISNTQQAEDATEEIVSDLETDVTNSNEFDLRDIHITYTGNLELTPISQDGGDTIALTEDTTIAIFDRDFNAEGYDAIIEKNHTEDGNVYTATGFDSHEGVYYWVFEDKKVFIQLIDPNGDFHDNLEFTE